MAPKWWEETGRTPLPEPTKAQTGGGPSWWTGTESKPPPSGKKGDDERPKRKGPFLSRLFGGAKDLVVGIPRGLAQAGSDAVKELTYFGSEVVGGQPHKKSEHETDAEHIARTMPLSAVTEASVRNTGNRLVHPTRLLADYSNDPVGTLVEDASNAALFLGPAARGAGAAARTSSTAARVAPGVAKVARVTNTVAEAPLVPFRAAGRGLGKAYEATAASPGALGETIRRLQLDPDSRLLRTQAIDPAVEQVSAGIGEAVKRGEAVAKVLPDLDEQRAMTLVGEGEATALAKLRANLPPDQFESYLSERFGDSLTRRAVDLAADVVEGAAPELAGRIDEALRLGRELPGGRAERSADYYGSGVPGRAEQAGFDPLSQVVEQRVKPLERLLPKTETHALGARAKADQAAAALQALRAQAPPEPRIDTMARTAHAAGKSTERAASLFDRGLPSTLSARRTAEARTQRFESGVDRVAATGERRGLDLGRAEMRAKVADNVARSAEARRASLSGKIEAARLDAEYSLEAAPARLRPVLQRNREAVQLLTQQENRLRGHGLNDAARLVGKAADELPTTLARLKDSGVDFDHFTHLKLDAKPTQAGVKSGALPRLRKGREDRQRTGSTTYDRTVRGQVQAEIDQLKIGVARETVEKIRTLPFTRQFASIAKAGEAGYAAWDPASPFEKSGQITKTTTFVPEHVFEAFRSYFNDPKWDAILKRTYDPAIQAFKVTVLPLSPSWQVGNVLGNALLATVAGGVSPAKLVAHGAEVVRTYRASGKRGERTYEAVGPRRLYTAGPTHAEFEFLKAPDDRVLGDGKVSRAVRTAGKPLSTIVKKSYALNGFVDDFGRSIVYLDQLEKGASPEVAVRSALKAMGDFSRMTPFERRWVRRAIPFYAWQRHLTKLAFTLPTEHPIRVAWTLHLADMFGTDEDTEGLPEYLRGAIPIGEDKLLGTSGLNPFSRIGGLVANPKDLPRSLSPVIKLAAENLPGSPARGRNLFTGRDYTRPPGTGDHDELGRPIGTAPSLVKQVTDLAPQKRLLEGVTGRNKVARYQSGDVILSGRRPIETPERDAGQAALKFLGFPISSRREAQEMAERIAKRQKDERKARERYERRRAAVD